LSLAIHLSSELRINAQVWDLDGGTVGQGIVKIVGNSDVAEDIKCLSPIISWVELLSWVLDSLTY
jgi:hypothetical protein